MVSAHSNKRFYFPFFNNQSASSRSVSAGQIDWHTLNWQCPIKSNNTETNVIDRGEQIVKLLNPLMEY